MAKDQRRHPRIKINRKAGLILPDGRMIPVTACDISKNGAGLLHDDAIVTPGAFCKAVISLPHYSAPRDAEMVALSRVVYCIYSGTHRKFRIGVQFNLFEEGSQTLLEDFLSYRFNYALFDDH